MIKNTEQKGVISMGRFVNSGNSAFQVALNSEIYVDKTGLLAYTNKVMDTTAQVREIHHCRYAHCILL